MPLPGQLGCIEVVWICKGVIEILAVKAGDFLVIEHQYVVGLNVEPPEAEVRRTTQNFVRHSIFSCDEYLVVLQVLEVRALDVFSAGRHC